MGNVLKQNRAVAALRLAFPNTSVEDRRLKPSHGYRAVHVIISINQRSVEVQVRTHEQHLWAELSEKLSDVVDSALKYGGGPVSTRETLLAYSRLVAEIEALEVAQFSSGTSLAEKESRFVDQMPNDPDWQVTAEILNQLRATQIEAEDATRGAKKLLAGLLTDYYNDLRQKP